VLARYGTGVFGMMQRAASSHVETLVHGREPGMFGTG
jgi:hypothetical protein